MFIGESCVYSQSLYYPTNALNYIIHSIVKSSVMATYAALTLKTHVTAITIELLSVILVKYWI
jgi:hypothetical protein